MGQRYVGELSVFDLLTGIAIGAVAGAGIVDPDLPHLGVLTSMMGLAVLHYGVIWLTKKWQFFGRITTFEPIVVIQRGLPLRRAMSRVNLTISDLMPLLREKDIFDLREVQYAVLETDGKITVIKEPAVQKPAGLTRTVILEGQVEADVLKDAGWDEARLRTELQRQGYKGPEEVFVATLDEKGSMYVVPSDAQQEGPAFHH